MNRVDVFKAVDSEREYQERRWKAHPHSYEDWITYIEDYTAEAKHLLCRNYNDDVIDQVSGIMRKVAGLAVACMEEHGVRSRP